MEIVIHGEKIGEFMGFPLTNTILMSWLVAAVLLAGAYLIRKRLVLVPGRIQGTVEYVIGGFYDFVLEVLGSKADTKKYFSFIITIFLFVVINNWFGILPGLGAVGIYEYSSHGEVFIPLFRSAASDINFTLALAIISVIATQIMGIAAIGFFKHASKYISFRGPIDFFVGLLELISEVAKMISFSFRLFGNIFAGEVLLIIISFLAPYIAPLPFLFLEIFVGFIQALVFAILTLVFIKIATVEHH